MTDEARVLGPDDLTVGMRASFDRNVTVDDILTFAANSGDRNPLHVDAEYAHGTRFHDRIAHGAFQVGLASALIGMYLPGRDVLLGSAQARFVAPLYFPCPVHVEGELIAWDRAGLSGTVKVVVQDAARHVPTSEIYLAFTMHEQRAGRSETPGTSASFTPHGGKPIAIVSGASGGLGDALVTALLADHRVLALVNRSPLSEGLRGHPDVREAAIDLAAPDWSTALEQALGDATVQVRAVVHAAWPGMPRGGLLDASDDTIDHQVRFGTTYTVRLARFLFGHVGPEGGRLVVVGSIAGTRQPNLATAAYSLGKAALESTVRLLAPELARRRITANAVCPAAVAVGMNKHQNERWRTLQAARVPLGRLCEPEDVGAAVRFLLSPEAGFLSGQMLELTGGQL